MTNRPMCDMAVGFWKFAKLINKLQGVQKEIQPLVGHDPAVISFELATACRIVTHYLDPDVAIQSSYVSPCPKTAMSALCGTICIKQGNEC